LVKLPQGNIVLDWVFFSPCAPSAPTAITSERRKAGTYGGLPVVAAAVSVFGGMTNTTLRCLRAIESAAGVEKNALVDVVVSSVIKGTSSCLQSARIRSGCSSPSPNSNSTKNSSPIIGIPVDSLPKLDDEDERSVFELGVPLPPTSSPTPSSPSHISTLPASVSQATLQKTNLAAQETIEEGNVLYVNEDGNVHRELGKGKSSEKNGGPTEPA
jgi:hypothetical protein